MRAGAANAGRGSDQNPLRLGILLSGCESNFVAIAQSIREERLKGVKIAVVISDEECLCGKAVARELGLTAEVILSQGRKRMDREAEVIKCLRSYRVDLVCLIGYQRLLSPNFIAAFPRRILNIHSSLLPAFPGLDAPQKALEQGVAMSGCTVHFVDERVNQGVIVLQRAIPVLEADDARSLADRIRTEEHIAYSEAIARVAGGEYEIRGQRYVKRSR
jgi:phosphoribosylglycinamide formyltransferase-1